MKNQKGFSSLIGIVIIVAVAVVVVGGIFGYQYLSQLKESANINNNQNIVGGDMDEHGCIGSAGYSWCEAKQKCLRAWEEPCEATVVDQTAGWKTYKNTKHGYQISYPEDVMVTEIDSGSDSSACVSITIKDDPLAPLGILIQSNGSSVPCGNTGRGTTDIKKQDTVNISGKQYIVDGDISPDNTGYFSFSLNDIGITYGGDLNDENLVSKLKQIISTFKFTTVE